MLRRSSGLDSTMKLSKLRKTSMGLGPSSVCILSRLQITNGEERIDLLRESQLLKKGFWCIELVNQQITASLLLCGDRHYAGSWFFGLPSRKTYRSCQKHESVSLLNLLSTGHLLGVFLSYQAYGQLYAHL